MKQYIFKSSEIFEDIPGDPDNVIMKFPPEILEATGWVEGDKLNISLEDGAIKINKV